MPFPARSSKTRDTTTADAAANPLTVLTPAVAIVMGPGRRPRSLQA
jgi:hypothetical protein